MFRRKRSTFIYPTLLLVILVNVSGVLSLSIAGETYHPVNADIKKNSSERNASNLITITDQQAKSVKIEATTLHKFASRKETVGYIDFNQDKLVQVFSPWQGRISQVVAKAGDEVKKGDTLFTLESPDLVQAKSTLISTASIVQLTGQALYRAKKLIETQANAQKDLDQAVSDQQAAEGNYKAARNALRVFGKTDAEMDSVIANRKTDGTLRITSPFTGRVTARNASVGMLVQPGTAPAPFSIADLTNMWMIASVSEYDLPQLRLGQHVSVSVVAYPGRKFEGAVTNIGAGVDPATHRIAVRSIINDSHHELRPQMLANFVINTGEAANSVAIPPNGVVREGDGTITVLVNNGEHRFERRQVKLGITQDGLVQILEGVSAGEKIVTDGAVFLSNALALQSK